MRMNRVTCMIIFLWAVDVNAGIEQYAVKGPYATKVLEFSGLSDASRGSRKVPIKVHFPEGVGPWPLIIFSHGAGGNWDANLPQSEHLASYGYVVLNLEHVGSNTIQMK